MRAVWIAYLVALHVFAIWLTQKAFVASASSGETFADRVEHGIRRSAQFRDVAVIVGDSRVEELAGSNIGERVENFGIGGDTLDRTAGRLPRYHLAGARAIIVVSGLNEWPARRFAGFEARYRAMLGAVPSQLPVVAAAILPVDEDAAATVWRGVNAGLPAANASIRRLCEDRVGCTFAESPFRGRLTARDHIGDGIHLSPAASLTMAASLREALARIAPSNPSTSP